MSVWQRIGQWLLKLWEAIFAGLKWIWDLLKPALEGIYKIISLLGRYIFPFFFALLFYLIEFASDFLGELFTGIFESIQDLLPAETLTLSGILSSNQQALVWTLYNYCALDSLVGYFSSFLVLVAVCSTARFWVWIGRKTISIVRGAGV
ncbi:MAG: hypothetical protein QXT77_06685 [Candidatus Methanomethylicaceae archaeon]